MKRTLLWMGFVVVCLPMVFAVWLLVAVESSKMDAATMHMPEAMRSLVVQGILGDYGDAPAMSRALKLDTAAVQSWQKQAALRAEQANARVTRISSEQQELYRTQAEDKKSAKALAARGKGEEQAGRACDAVMLFAKAEKLDEHADVFAYEEGMGRAGLKCGDLQQARNSLEKAVEKETRFIEGTQEDQLSDVRESLRKDREFLVVVYDRQHEGAMANAACTKAHPGWKNCECALAGDGDVKCEEKR